MWITTLDAFVRRLEELGLRDDTLIVFSADQGWNAGHHGVWGKGNATIPFNMYEESIRVPLIWNHPGKIRGGRTIDKMVSTYDFFPTMLDYLGVPAPAPDRQRVGRSYAPFLRGENPAWRNELYFEYCYTRAIRTENLKYVERAEEWPNELFDLEADPTEDTNVIGSAAEPGPAQCNAYTASRVLPRFRSSTDHSVARFVRNVLTIDTGYYDKWLEFRTKE